MTRFDAVTPEERVSLVADAIEAHRERQSLFCTVEADGLPEDATATQSEEPDDGDLDIDASAPEEQAADGSEATPAWIQFSEAEGLLNLDCTDEEYERVTAVVSEFPTFTVRAQESPEDADGRNLRIEARADADRIGQVVDSLFLEGFGYEEDYRLWATEL